MTIKIDVYHTFHYLYAVLKLDFETMLLNCFKYINSP